MGNVIAVKTKLWGWIDLVHSEDDGGWYAHRWIRTSGEINDLATGIYATEARLRQALTDPSIVWEGNTYCADCGGAGEPLGDRDHEQLTKCGNCKGWY